MPAALNFATLQQDMQSYLERGGTQDVTVFNQLPRLINLAERSIAREIKVQGFIVPVTTTLPMNTSTLAKPDGWRETVSFFYGVNQERIPLFPRSYEYCRAYWPDPTKTSKPKFYSDYDYSNWLLVPTFDQIYNIEINYYSLPPLLDPVNTNNWLTNFAPEVLQYRAFAEMALFLKAYADSDQFMGKYTAALSSINVEDLQKIADRSTTRQEA